MKRAAVLAWVSAGLVFLAAGWCAAPGRAAPAPEDKESADRFQTLKQRLPEVVADFVKKTGISGVEPKVGEVRGGAPRESEQWEASVRLVRRLSPTEARAKIVFSSSRLGAAAVISVHLWYFDGAWTTTGFESTYRPEVGIVERMNFEFAVRMLMLAIDDITGK